MLFVSSAFGNVGIKYDLAGISAKCRVNTRLNIFVSSSRSCFMMARTGYATVGLSTGVPLKEEIFSNRKRVHLIILCVTILVRAYPKKYPISARGGMFPRAPQEEFRNSFE